MVPAPPCIAMRCFVITEFQVPGIKDARDHLQT
jgi:hypothetical protein